MSLHVRHFVENCVSLQSVREEKWCLLQVCLRKLIFHTFLSLSHTRCTHNTHIHEFFQIRTVHFGKYRSYHAAHPYKLRWVFLWSSLNVHKQRVPPVIKHEQCILMLPTRVGSLKLRRQMNSSLLAKKFPFKMKMTTCSIKAKAVIEICSPTWSSDQFFILLANF